MSLLNNYVGVTNTISKQINPVNIFNWVFIPAIIGLFLCFIIIAVWQPKFSGTYTYRECKNDSRSNGNRNCVEKEGDTFKRNVFTIIIMLFLFPSLFAGFGYRIGFAIANPKITAGLFAIDSAKDSLFD